eukprot:1146377-Pelagomonas_calceolata.AAC.2
MPHCVWPHTILECMLYSPNTLTPTVQLHILPIEAHVQRQDEKERHLWPQHWPRTQVKPSVSGLKAQETGSVQPHDWQTKASHV